MRPAMEKLLNDLKQATDKLLPKPAPEEEAPPIDTAQISR